MKLTLQRETAGANGTRGLLFIDGVKFCNTIEPAPDSSHPSIKAGTYNIIVTRSPRFKKPLPLLLGVVGRTGIRIHGGTKPEHSQGCICIPITFVSPLTAQITSSINHGENVSISIIDPCGTLSQ